MLSLDTSSTQNGAGPLLLKGWSEGCPMDASVIPVESGVLKGRHGTVGDASGWPGAGAHRFAPHV